MSELVKRLRDREFFSRTGERHELLAAADRIEQLEAALREILDGAPDAFDLARAALAPAS